MGPRAPPIHNNQDSQTCGNIVCFHFGKSDYPTLPLLHGQLPQSNHAAGTGFNVEGEGFPAAEQYSSFLENMGAQVAVSFRSLPGLSV